MEHIGIYLRDIYFNQKRGQLSFHFKEYWKHLFFQEGFLVYAKTNHPDELLGEVLFRLGKLSSEEYSRIDTYIEPHKSIGSVLVGRGIITEESLKEGLVYQMREIVLNMFSVFRGEFRFHHEVDLSEQVFDVKLKVPVLIEEGIRRMKFNPILQRFLEHRKPYPKSVDFFLRLTEEERDVLARVDGKTPASELLQGSGVAPESFWKALYLCYCLDLIGFRPEEKPSPPEPEKERAPVDQERLSDVLKLHEEMPHLNYFQLLGLGREATPEEVKKAYFGMARKYHPDLFGRELDPEVQEKISAVFDGITKAYNTLLDEEKRHEYEKHLDAPEEAARRNQTQEAEKRFRQGKTLFNQGRYEEALVFLEQAIRLRRDKANYFLLLALIQAKLPMYRKEAEQSFLRAINLEPWNAEAFVGLGLLYKEEGLHVRARKQFEKALQVDPDHRIARRELREAKGEKERKTSLKDMKLKDLLTMDIFGKKKKKK
ncbi:MAG: DUF4388 domain-containing protein [Candidatus Aminicenantales bacterium]